jgi:hypothetical protein
MKLQKQPDDQSISTSSFSDISISSEDD